MKMFAISNSALIMCKDHKDLMLVVERKENPHLLAFPGGKLEDGEEALENLHREVLEEVGLNLNEHQVSHVYSGECINDEGQSYWATTYLVEIPYSEDFKNNEGLNPQWVCIEDFKDRAAFSHYSQRVLDAYLKQKDEMKLFSNLSLFSEQGKINGLLTKLTS